LEGKFYSVVIKRSEKIVFSKPSKKGNARDVLGDLAWGLVIKI